MTTNTLHKTSGWRNRGPYEQAREVASGWGFEAPHTRVLHASRVAARPAKARGYQQKIHAFSAEPVTLNVIFDSSQLIQNDLYETFQSLKERWATETAFASATVDIVLNDAYQQIIGLGPAALPLILNELEHNGGQWFWALRMISRQDPVPRELRGKTKRMAEVWINWAKEHAII